MTTLFERINRARHDLQLAKQDRQRGEETLYVLRRKEFDAAERVAALLTELEQEYAALQKMRAAPQ